MNKNKKIFRRLLAAALTALTLVCALGIASSAVEFNDVYQYEEAIDTLSEIGVIRGVQTDPPLYAPNRNVERWQMALLLTKLITGDTDDSYWGKANDSFKDVKSSHWPNSIAYCSEHEIIIGDGNGNFYPENGITLQDGATMVIRALGYPRSVYDSGYPKSYIQKAEELHLFDGLENVGYTATLTRGQTAQLLYNAFTATRHSSLKGTIAETVFGYKSTTLVLTATDNVRINPNMAMASPGYLRFNVLRENGTFGTAYTLRAALVDIKDPDAEIGRSYKVVSTNNFANILSVTPCTMDSVADKLIISSGAVDSITIGATRYKTVSAYSYELKENATPSSREMIVYGFGEMWSLGSVITAKDMASTNAVCTMNVFDDNGDGYYDRAIYTPSAFGRITTSTNEYKIEGKTNLTLRTSLINLKGLTPSNGDFIIYSYTNPNLDIQEKLTAKTGILYAYDLTNKTVTIGNSRYSLGCENLYGADASSATKEFTNTTAGFYNGASVTYVLYNNSVIYIDLPDNYNGGSSTGTEGSVNSANIHIGDCCVVAETPTYDPTSGCLLVKVYVGGYNVTTTTTLYIKSVNGTAVTGLGLGSMLSKGDFIRCELAASTSGVAYNAVTLNDKPYFTTNSSAFYLRSNTSTSLIGMTSSALELYSTASFSPLASIGYSNNTIFLTMTSNGDIGTFTIPAASSYQLYSGYSLYIGCQSTATNTAAIVYVRPKVTSGGNIPGTNPGGGNYSTTTCGIVTEANNYGMGTLLMRLVGISDAFSVSTLNGVPIYSTTTTLSPGDFVEYGVASNSGTGMVTYAVNNLTNKPYFTSTVPCMLSVSASSSQSSLIPTYTLSVNNGLTAQSSVIIDANTKLYIWNSIYNGVTTPTLSTLNNMTLPAGYSIYVAYPSGTNNAASMVYIRPSASGSGSGGTVVTTFFSSIANISNVNYVTNFNGSYVYKGKDMITGQDIDLYCASRLTVNGYYKYVASGIQNQISDATPVTTAVQNSDGSVKYMPNQMLATITADTANPGKYNVTFSTSTYNSASIIIYAKGSDNTLFPYDMSKIDVLNLAFKAFDVFVYKNGSTTTLIMVWNQTY